MVADGEPHDVAIVTDHGFEELARQGKLVPGSRADIAKSAMALAVQKGAPRPDISSGEKFKQALLAAKSLGMSNPVGGGQSGANLAKIFDKLGITEAMKAKAVYGPGGPAGLIGQLPGPQGGRDRHPAIARTDGGAGHRHRRPAAAGHPGDDGVPAGLSTTAKNAEGAKALIAFLTTPKAAAVIKAKGMEAG